MCLITGSDLRRMGREEMGQPSLLKSQRNTSLMGGNFIKSHEGLCFPTWLLTIVKKRNKTEVDLIEKVRPTLSFPPD